MWLLVRLIAQNLRGAHTREDYPKRDDEKWLKRTLASWESDTQTLPTLSYEDLDIMSMEIAPGFRGYGAKGMIIETVSLPNAKPRLIKSPKKCKLVAAIAMSYNRLLWTLTYSPSIKKKIND